MSNICRREHARLVVALIQQERASFVGFGLTWSDTSSLRINDQLGTRAILLGDTRIDLVCRTRSIPAIDWGAADPHCIESEDRNPSQFPFHDELGAVEAAHVQNDVEKRLVLRDNGHIASRDLSTDFASNPAQETQQPDDMTTVEFHEIVRHVSRNSGRWRSDDPENQHPNVHDRDEKQRSDDQKRVVHSTQPFGISTVQRSSCNRAAPFTTHLVIRGKLKPSVDLRIQSCVQP